MAFLGVFAGVDLSSPQRHLSDVDRHVGILAGLNVQVGLLGAFDDTGVQLQPYVLETVLIWQQARVAAARGAEPEFGLSRQRWVDYLYLLRRGQQLLTMGDPVAGLRGWLPGGRELR